MEAIGHLFQSQIKKRLKCLRLWKLGTSLSSLIYKIKASCYQFFQWQYPRGRSHSGRHCFSVLCFKKSGDRRVLRNYITIDRVKHQRVTERILGVVLFRNRLPRRLLASFMYNTYIGRPFGGSTDIVCWRRNKSC